MIIHHDIACHHCAELVPMPSGGMAIARLPTGIIPVLSRIGRWHSETGTSTAWAHLGIDGNPLSDR
jgi:hypothetical protein